MTKDVARYVISQLDQSGFIDFFYYLLKNDNNFLGVRKLEEIDPRIIECPPERFYQCADTFIINHYPTSIYRNFKLEHIDLKLLQVLIDKYLSQRVIGPWLPVNGTTIYSVSNFNSADLGMTDDELLEYYQNGMRQYLCDGINIGIGNINTILDKQTSDGKDINSLISSYFKELKGQLCIGLSEEGG